MTFNIIRDLVRKKVKIHRKGVSYKIKWFVGKGNSWGSSSRKKY